MPKRIEGVSARLLTCAKQEFIEKGFQGASIRQIAQKAETSPRAIYTRFPHKEGLFRAIVSPVVTEFKKLLQEEYLNYSINQTESKIDFSMEKGFQDLMNYIYDHFEEFKLLVTRSEGTEFAGFVDELVKIDVDLTIEKAKNKNNEYNSNKTETNQLLQLMLTRSFYTCMFEPIISDLSREDAMFYIGKLRDFFTYGLAGILKD